MTRKIWRAHFMAGWWDGWAEMARGASALAMHLHLYLEGCAEGFLRKRGTALERARKLEDDQ